MWISRITLIVIVPNEIYWRRTYIGTLRDSDPTTIHWWPTVIIRVIEYSVLPKKRHNCGSRAFRTFTFPSNPIIMSQMQFPLIQPPTSHHLKLYLVFSVLASLYSPLISTSARASTRYNWMTSGGMDGAATRVATPHGINIEGTEIDLGRWG